MGKQYNYYDTPSNHPETVKYRKWESAILIFAIGVVSTLLLIHYAFGQADNPTRETPAQEIIIEDTSQNQIPSCQIVNQIQTLERDRLIQLLALANDLPIADVVIQDIGEICYDENRNPNETIMTDIIVTVEYTEAAKQHDYEILGYHVTEILPSMMQIQPANPRQVIIRFLVEDTTYLEWSHSYNKANLFSQSRHGEDLWFWVEPDY